MCNMLSFLCLALFGARLAASKPGGAQVPVALTADNSTRGKLTVQCVGLSMHNTTKGKLVARDLYERHFYERHGSYSCHNLSLAGDYYERPEVQSEGVSTFWKNDIVDYSFGARVITKCGACDGEMYILSDGYLFDNVLGDMAQGGLWGSPSYAGSLPWLSFKTFGQAGSWDESRTTARVTAFTSAAGVATTRPGELQMASSVTPTAEAKAAEEMDEAAVAAAARDGGLSHGQRATAIMAFAATAAAAFAVRAAGRRAAAGSATGASAPLLSA